MNNDIVLNSGWIKIEKEDLDILRRTMRDVYKNQGGSKKFNSHLPNYEELRTLMRSKIDNLMETGGKRILIHGQEYFDIVPGNTFFRDLFYSKKDAESPQFQEYNIEVCYLYAYGQTRFEYKHAIKTKKKEAIEAEAINKADCQIIVSSTVNNMVEAEKLKEHFLKNFGIKTINDTRNSPAYKKGSLSELYNSLDEKDYVLSLISRDYLQNEQCAKELVEFTKIHLEKYLKHTIHILLKDVYSGDYNIYDTLGRSELLKYWKLRIEQLEENHKLIMSGRKEKAFYKKLKKEFEEIKEIMEELHRVIDLIRENPSGAILEIFLSKVNRMEDLEKLLPRKETIGIELLELETTYKRIKIPSTNNPSKPEFPPAPFYEPSFPASTTRKIEVPGLTNVWLKDESTNPTGTHKDRMAWEVVIKYKSLIEAVKYKSRNVLPQMSIISSGSAAIAIQHFFNLYEIPTKLKVLADNNLNAKIKADLVKIGCEVYECDLSAKLLSSDDIKRLTDNDHGIDITYREVLDPTHDNYYDWMSYEILRENPDYCFVPFGTGDLFINILNIIKIEYFNSFIGKHDPRFSGDIQQLIKCNFFGASTRSPNTKLDKLFSYFLPSLDKYNTYFDELKEEYGCVGQETNVIYVDESYVDEAIALAKEQNVSFEPSGVAGMALLLQEKSRIPQDAKVILVNTGKTRSVESLLKFKEEMIK
jgi:cysteine synthase